MKRKSYSSPTITEFALCTQLILMASTLEDPTKEEQDITPTDDPYGGEFQSRRKSQWDDDEEEEDENF